MHPDTVQCILPVDLSNRLLVAVASRSYKNTSLKVYLLVNKHNADVNTTALAPNPYGSCVLAMALGSRRDDGAIALLDLGANPNLPLGLRGQHPLIDTAFKGCPLVLESMFKHGADFNVTNGWGNTVLVAAITRGHVESVRFLLETVKLDPNIPGGSGLRVMHIEDTNVPMEHDVSWNVRRDMTWTPLHAATDLKHPDGVEIVKLLLKAGANALQRCEHAHSTISGFDGLGYTPLELLTIHALLPSGFNFRHDPKAMVECQTILEEAMKKTIDGNNLTSTESASA
jgi:ankyrin repeat protein